MADRPFLRSVGGFEPAVPEPPSVLFQQLSAEYPDLPRRVVGEVLSRVHAAACGPTADPVRRFDLDAMARTLLDAMRVRADDAARRTGRPRALRAVSGDSTTQSA